MTDYTLEYDEIRAWTVVADRRRVELIQGANKCGNYSEEYHFETALEANAFAAQIRADKARAKRLPWKAGYPRITRTIIHKRDLFSAP